MHDVFLSYAREDVSSAKEIAKELLNSGLTVWWDRRVEAGQNFHVVIQQALDQSNCVVVLWSKHSVDSEWVLNEATHGAEHSALIPLMLHPVRIPIAFRSRQTVNWFGDKAEAIGRIVWSVRMVTDQRSEHPPNATPKATQETPEIPPASIGFWSNPSIETKWALVVVWMASCAHIFNPSYAAHKEKFGNSIASVTPIVKGFDIQRELQYNNYHFMSTTTQAHGSIFFTSEKRLVTRTIGAFGFVFVL